MISSQWFLRNHKTKAALFMFIFYGTTCVCVLSHKHTRQHCVDVSVWRYLTKDHLWHKSWSVCATHLYAHITHWVTIVNKKEQRLFLRCLYYHTHKRTRKAAHTGSFYLCILMMFIGLHARMTIVFTSHSTVSKEWKAPDRIVCCVIQKHRQHSASQVT